ncbi:MAG: twin-arginine translocase subunit TatB [Acetobacteraceae bacterium]|nr:twin-arginine translocase subunit TatB [Acetobacteraceae bacterium]
MFDFAWSELAIVGVVALLVIGPKDLPAAIKAVGEIVRKARRMASEFQTHVDEMVKDADLQEVRNQINEIRNFDIKGALEKQIDSDGSIRAALQDPLDTSNTPTPLPSTDPVDPDPAPEPGAPEPAASAEPEAEDTTPAFIPPAIAHPPAVPDFLPPATHRPQPGL